MKTVVRTAAIGIEAGDTAPVTFRKRPDEGLPARWVLPVVDLTADDDAGLHGFRIRRIIAVCGSVLVLALGVTGAVLLTGPPVLQVLAFGAILGGLFREGLAIGGLVRVVSEQRSRAFERAVEAHQHRLPGEAAPAR